MMKVTKDFSQTLPRALLMEEDMVTHLGNTLHNKGTLHKVTLHNRGTLHKVTLHNMGILHNRDTLHRGTLHNKDTLQLVILLNMHQDLMVADMALWGQCLQAVLPPLLLHMVLTNFPMALMVLTELTAAMRMAAAMDMVCPMVASSSTANMASSSIMVASSSTANTANMVCLAESSRSGNEECIIMIHTTNRLLLHNACVVNI